MPPEVLRANPSIASMTTDGVLATVKRKMGAQPTQMANATPGTATDANPSADFLGRVQTPNAPAQTGSEWPSARWRQLNAMAEYAAQGQAMGYVKPGMAEQYRHMADQERERGRKQLTTVNGRTAVVDRISGDVSFNDEAIERVRDAQGRERITPRSQAVNQTSYPEAPSGYRNVTDAQGNIVDQAAYAGGPGGAFACSPVMTSNFCTP